jgi:putative PIN family toxin of toxin-antitoxin system
MRVVLDTNILLSALLNSESIPGRVVDARLDDGFVLVTHALQLEEIRTVTRRPRFRGRFRPAEAGRLVNLIHDNADFAGRLPRIRRSADASDDFLLAVCQAGETDYLVTGNKAGLLELSTHGRTAIVTARNFLDVLGKV